jgi:parvulin-like peptidyl-prolyl isomerase
LAKKKKKAEKPPREFTRRQLSQLQRQRRRQRIIFYGGVFIIAAVILIVLIGWYMGEIRPLHKTVIRVYDTEFDTDYYIDAVKFVGRDYSSEYLQSLAQSLATYIEQNELIRQAAENKLGISISDDEVKEQLEDNGLPINDASIDFSRIDLLRDRLYEEYFGYQVPATDNQVYMRAMLLESQSQANEITELLKTSDNFTGLAEEYSLDYYSQGKKGDLGWHSKEMYEVYLGSAVPGDYAFNAEVGTLSEPIYDEELGKNIGYWLVNILEKEGAQTARVQVILMGSQQEANVVVQRLVMGEDFSALAEEFSQDEESRELGGELGIVTKGENTTAFDAFVFSTDIEAGTMVGPFRDDEVETKGGYWLIEVLDREDNRQIEDEDKEYLVDQAYSDWLSQLWSDAGDEIDGSGLTEELMQWIIERL